MSTKRNSIVAGGIAAIIAIALIAAAIGSGYLGPGSVSTSKTGSGTLAVMLTDPPTVPNGVTAVYMTYSDLQVHVSDAGNESGWIDLHSSGEINLMSVINATQTVASAKIQSGTFDALKFNITSAKVTYQGTNYTADLVYKEHTLYTKIVGGITVKNGTASAAVIDLTPTILLLGNTTSPTFAFLPVARAYTIPAQSVNKDSLHIGAREDIHGEGWWEAIEHSSRFEITSASLSANSISVTVKNTGNTSIVFRAAAITATSSNSGGWKSYVSTSEAFVVESNASLVALNSTSRMEAYEMLAAGGYLLPPGSSVTFTYSGGIELGGMLRMQSGNTQAIVSGQPYIITVLGSDLHAQTQVIAS